MALIPLGVTLNHVDAPVETEKECNRFAPSMESTLEGVNGIEIELTWSLVYHPPHPIPPL